MINITIEEILELYEGKQFPELKRRLSEINATDLAQIFEEIPPERLPVLYRLLPKELAAEVFVEMDSDLQMLVIKGFSDVELRNLINEMYVDDTVDLIEEMPANVVKRILANADASTRKEINEILQYPKESAGSIMTTEYVTLRETMTVQQAFEKIKRTGPDSETIYTCYVIKPDRKLCGVVSARQLLLSELDEIIENIMEKNVISVHTHDDKEEVAKQIREYGFLALPVVDNENRLVGIVTVDDAMDVISEESEEDFSKMAAITPTDTTYLKTTVWDLWKARIPWLLLLMISATFTGLIITSFEHALSSQIALTAFIPMLMDTAGNSGSQASVTIIRAISLDEVEFKDIFKVQAKELLTATFCGLTLASVNFVKIFLVDILLFKTQGLTLTIAGVVCVTLLITVVAAKFVGCSLPIIAKKLRFDPAVMASPLITTIVDIISLLVYFGIATRILP